MRGHLLKQTLVVYRATAGAPNNEYNQPTLTYDDIATLQGSVQPKSGSELALVTEGGPVRGQYRIFLPITDIREGDQIVSGDEVYEPTFIADAAGQGDHLEIDAERVYP